MFCSQISTFCPSDARSDPVSTPSRYLIFRMPLNVFTTFIYSRNVECYSVWGTVVEVDKNKQIKKIPLRSSSTRIKPSISERALHFLESHKRYNMFFTRYYRSTGGCSLIYRCFADGRAEALGKVPKRDGAYVGLCGQACLLTLRKVA